MDAQVHRSALNQLPPFMSNFNGWWLVVLVGLVLFAASLFLFDYLMDAFLDSRALRSQVNVALFIFFHRPAVAGGGLSRRPYGAPPDSAVRPRHRRRGGVFFLSAARGLWTLYAVTAAAVGQSLSGWVPQITILSRWFVRHRATAIGLALVVSSILGLALGPFTRWSLDPSGWRLAALGGLVVVIAVLAFARLRDRPEDVGLLPDGGPPAAPQSSLSTGQALHTRAFWLIVLGDGLASIGILTVPLYVQSVYDSGLSPNLEATDTIFLSRPTLVGAFTW